MRPFFSDFLIQLKGIWARLDGGQRLVVLAVLGATVVGLGSIVWYAGRPSYEVVFTARTPEDMEQMQQALATANVSYQMADDGWTFTVERAKVGLATAAKNKAGLSSRSDPALGGASSIMDDAETKSFKLAQAAIAQVQSAILQLQGVASVKVTANKPRKQSAFRDRDNENKPSATVILAVKSGAQFIDIAKAASNLAASQLMIPIANIEVFSSTGAQRYRFDPDRETGGGSSDFLNLQRNMAAEKARLAQERLDQMWPGKTSVSVQVELDPLWEITSQKMLPAEPLVKTEKTSKDSTVKPQGKAADPNGSSTEVINVDKQNNETKDRTFVTEIGEKRSGRMAPDIRRMTVAVIYDKSLEKDGFNKDELIKAVKSIVGWDKKRDSDEDFSTMASEFAPIDLSAELATGPGIADIALRWGPTIGQILGVIVVVVFLKGLFKRSSRTASDSAGPMERISAAKAGETPEAAHQRMRKEIEKSITEDPAALAKLLESWLTEQKA